ncbi:GID8 [Cordylochernes scorpioides]|uniref:GID8 n=1 Tax=Cordylochernes scorpioides TaxID=51811 RepID=A0ABY6KUW2_9ARAC|nr:GID8 [Cordylochernes scorpioides]
MDQHMRPARDKAAPGDMSSKEEWMERLSKVHVPRADMNQLIMDYLVTGVSISCSPSLGCVAEGFKEAAEKFSAESGITPTEDLSSLDCRIKIRDAIQAGRIQEAIDLVNSLHPELLDRERYLYFHLQQQCLIELIRDRQVEDALEYAQQNLAERGLENSAVLAEMERTIALLAFDEPENSPFGDLLLPAHRQKVASEVNSAILQMENRRTTQPRLSLLLKMLLWAQEELDGAKVRYPKMADIAHGHFAE